MHLEKSFTVGCADLPPTRQLAFRRLQEIYPPPNPLQQLHHQSRGGDVAPAGNCNSVNSLHCIGFSRVCVIAGRLAQSMVTRPIYILRLIVQQEMGSEQGVDPSPNNSSSATSLNLTVIEGPSFMEGRAAVSC